MMADNDTRKLCLRNLLQLENDIPQLKADLSHFPWDSPEELITLERKHLEKVLDRYLSGKLTDNDVIDWANLVESRDDIGYETAYGDMLKDLIFQLANPEINGGLNKSQLLRDLQFLRG